ncbi:MAG: hypothetical protein AAAFM81_02015 [Pseudomonadota bacterium]
MSKTSFESIAELLADVIDCLDASQHVYWLQNLITARNAILRGEASGVDRFLSLDGPGMSLPALQLEDSALQSRFDQMLSLAFKEARTLKESS